MTGPEYTKHGYEAKPGESPTSPGSLALTTLSSREERAGVR
jgi:hypothetical protein